MKQRRSTARNTVNGALRSYIHLQRRGEVDDGFGNMVPGGEFVTEFSVYANFRSLLRGSASGVEDVFADRIQGNQPFVVTVRRNKAFESVTHAWRIADARSDDGTGKFLRTFNIKSPPTDSTNGYMWLEFVAVLDAPS